MNNLQQAVDVLLRFCLNIGDIIIAGFIAGELWLRMQLTQLSVPAGAQTVLLFSAAVVLILLAMQLLEGLIRVVVILVLLLIAIHIVMPLVQT